MAKTNYGFEKRKRELEKKKKKEEKRQAKLERSAHDKEAEPPGGSPET
jgi:hypothetical protein